MTTTVTLTGTGVPIPTAGRAGASVLVVAEGLALQFDAGRAVTLRWADAGLDCGALGAVFLTHHHSDHLVGLADLVFASWESDGPNPLPICAPLGPTADFARALLDPWRADIDVRMQHVEGIRLARGPAVDVRAFAVRRRPTEVWRTGDVSVDAIEVHHEPVLPAVGYRVTTPDGRVAISGDTAVCPEMEELASGCEVLVHEAALGKLRTESERTRLIAEYHADARELGAMAQRAGVGTLVLTHMVPSPVTTDEEEVFADEVRDGGFRGELLVGRDLMSVEI